MTAGTVPRMFGVWLAVVLVDGILAVALVPSDTAGYLSLVGAVGVLLWTRARHAQREPRTGTGSGFGGD